MDDTILHKPETILSTPPDIHPTTFVAPGVQIISRVKLAAESSIWFQCTLRGDINDIIIGEKSNIQDGSVLHVTNNLPCIVEPMVSVGHHVNLHGCTVKGGTLIGIGAIVLSGAVVEKNCIIAAGAVIKENFITEPDSLYAGVPAKKIRNLSRDEIQKNYAMVEKYVKLAEIYRQRQG
jgi:carbonic anhydrase/acetyltransferase-like protein (isoleucine patch superfamily)